MAETKLTLAELVPYREHQIASRSLSRKLNLALPLAVYAMAAGESISTETASQTRLLQCVAGQLTVQFADHAVAVAPGELLVVPAGMPHALVAQEACKFIQMESEARA